MFYNISLSPFEILYIKSIWHTILNYLFCHFNGVFILDIPHEYRNIIVFRGLIGYVGIQGIWGAAKYMPITLASCITTTAPIWLAILAHFYLGETISKFDVFAIFTSFAGVLIINNPF